MPISKRPLVLDYDSALERGRKYCAYQERSQQEVRDKLYQLGLHRKEVELAISQLVTEGFLNEERFAMTFARGKFRIRKWGRIKIEYALKEKKVTPYCIRKALSQFDEREYRNTLEQVLKSRSGKGLKSVNPAQKRQLARYAFSRGFEPSLVWRVLGEKE